MEELALGIDAEADEVKELLQVVDVMAAFAVGDGGGLEKVFDVLTHIGKCPVHQGLARNHKKRKAMNRTLIIYWLRAKILFVVFIWMV